MRHVRDNAYVCGSGIPGIVHVVDDDDAVRTSIRFILELAGFSVQTYPSAKSLLSSDLAPAGCILTDFHMPDTDGLQLNTRLIARNIQLPVIVMTGHADVPLAVRALKGGAVDFLEKPFIDDQLIVAVTAALQRNAQTLKEAAGAANAAKQLECLTAREREVLELLVTGKTNKAIAQALGTSPRTIDVHRARVFQKLNADTVPDLVHLVLAARQVLPRL